MDLLLQMNKGTLEGVIGVIGKTLSVKKTVSITEDTNALLKFSHQGSTIKGVCWSATYLESRCNGYDELASGCSRRDCFEVGTEEEGL